MASKSYPRAGHNSGEVTTFEHELLVSHLSAEGLIGDPSDLSLAYTDGIGTRQVRIRENRLAWLRGSLWDSQGDVITMPALAANTSGQPRIDLIVLRLDRSDYTVTETAITGTPAVQPVAPSPVRTYIGGGVYDLPVATVAVAHNADALASNAVTDIAWYLGEDGQIRCRSAARPPHHAGRWITETDTGRTLLSNGVAWSRVVEDSGWVTPTASSGWSIGNTRVRRHNGTVYLRSAPYRTGSNITANTTNTMYTLPDQFRPDVSLLLTSRLDGGHLALTEVHTNGAVTVRNNPVILQTGWYCIASQASWPTVG